MGLPPSFPWRLPYFEYPKNGCKDTLFRIGIVCFPKMPTVLLGNFVSWERLNIIRCFFPFYFADIYFCDTFAPFFSRKVHKGGIGFPLLHVPFRWKKTKTILLGFFINNWN